MRNPLKDQRGAALIMVMITFMVVAILGGIVATAALGEVNQAAALDKDMRAYYKARSAADATITWIQTELDEIDAQADALEAMTHDADITEEELDAAKAAYEARVAEFNKLVPEDEGTQSEATSISGLDGIDKLVVYREAEYIIAEAQATVNSMKAGAKVRIEQDATVEEILPWSENVRVPLFNEAIYANDDLTFNGNANIVYGDVRYEGDLVNRTPNTPGYSCAQNLIDRVYPVWNPPSDLPGGGTWSNSLTPADSGIYESVTLGNKTTLTIDTQGGSVKLHIKELTYTNTLTIKALGTGKVFLFVDSLTCAGGNVNISIISSEENEPNVFLILNCDYEFKLAGNDEFQAYLYAPFNDMVFSGNPDIYGAVIAKNFRSNGNTYFKYNKPDLESGEFNNEDPEIDQSVPHALEYERLGAMGANSKVWIREGE